MKLKALNPRLYNLMFHTHTVTGIVISFVLFIIFYAGAFSLFRDELYKWENPLARFETQHNVDFDATITLIENHVDEQDLFKSISIVPPSDTNPFIQFSGTYKVPRDEKRSISYYINPYTKVLYKDPHGFNDPNALTYMGDTIYRLHYLRAIIPAYGIYIAGLIGFFFLFAIVTGVLIHWKNIINKFYDFRVKGKWKQIWANTHTTIGAITLPFQFIFAVTGSLLGLSLLLLAPSALLLFDGDRDEIIKLVRPSSVIKYEENAKDISSTITINQLYKEVTEAYPQSHVNRIQIANLGKDDGTILFQIDNEKNLSGEGEFLYSYKDGTLLNEISPNNKTYTQSAYNTLIKLHYSNFGGYFLKVIYFILAMLTCYVITSGVMVWKTARDTPKYTDKQKRFHHRVTKFYLAFTSSIFPAIALIFIANKIFPITMEYRVVYVKNTFFIGWILLTIIGLFWNNYKKLNRNYLLIGSLLAILIPISNGIVTGDWFFISFAKAKYIIASIDIFWLLTGISGLLIAQLNRKRNNLETKKTQT